MSNSKTQVLRDLPAGNSEVTSLYWCEKGLFAGDLDGNIFIYETDNSPSGGQCHIGQCHNFKVHNLAVSSICYINDNVFSCSLDGNVSTLKFNAQGKNDISSIKSITDCFVICPVGSMDMVLFGTTSGSLYFYDISKENLSEPLKLFTNSAVCSISLHPTENKVGVLSNQEFVLVNLDKREEEKRLKITADKCTCCAISDNALSCVISTTEGSVRIVDMITFKEVGCVVIDQTELNKVASIDYGKRFVLIGCNGKVTMFNLNTMLKETGNIIERKPLLALAVQPVDMKIAVAGCDKNITLLGFEK